MKLKYIFILLVTTAFVQQAFAQSRPGFVQQENIKVAGILADSQIDTLSVTRKQTTRSFYDGLGRGLQTIGVQASPLQNDLVAPAAYDNLGRQTIGYLPYAGQSTDTMGSYRGNAISTAQPAFYNQTTQYLIAADAAPYTQSVFENSPLQRLLRRRRTGNIRLRLPEPDRRSHRCRRQCVCSRLRT